MIKFTKYETACSGKGRILHKKVGEVTRLRKTIECEYKENVNHVLWYCVPGLLLI